MKKILLSLVVVLSALTASARSLDSTAVVATVTGSEHGIQRVTLLEDGRLQVTPLSKSGKTSTIVLSAAASRELLAKARTVANAELKETRREIVCRAMMLPSLSKLSVSSFDEEQDEFTGDVRVTLTNSHCSMKQIIAPALPYVLQAAQELRSNLVILAFNSLKSKASDNE